MSSVDNILEKTDTASLAVVTLIMDRFRESSKVVGSGGNIFAVFFHDLVVHFSGILMHRIAREYYEDSVKFPKVNKYYALSPYRVNSEDLVPVLARRTLKAYIREFPFSRLALGDALPFGHSRSSVTSKTVNLLGSYKPFVRAYLPKEGEQIGWLLETVDEVCQLHEIQKGNVIRENWHRYAKCHITDKQGALRERGVLLGTRNKLQNRKLAVNYLQQGKEVVAVSHGEVSNSVMDEPPFGYSERTLCTTLVDYGDFNEDGDYNAPLITPARTVYRSSPTVTQQYRRNERIRRPDFDRCRALYIPTTYSGNDLYGPFHIYEDAVYRQWQSVLFEVLSGLIMKVHPKSKSGPPPGVIVEQRPLEECIVDYDLLVFDYFATGAMLALISEKPVIYFDIGLRRLAPKFMCDVINRCEYARIDLFANIHRQCSEALEKFWSSDREWSNAEIARYSLCENEYFRWSKLLRAATSGSFPT